MRHGGRHLSRRKRRYRIRLLAPGLVFVATILFVSAGFSLAKWVHGLTGDPLSPTNQPTPPVSAPAPKNMSIYTGREVAAEVYRRRPLAVMIDNLSSARPQSGLEKADMVYEVLAEGGITRFFALFQGDADVVGPVRSVRHYFLDLVLEHSAILAHCGQSPQAEADIPALKINNINEIAQGRYFWRSKDRQAPHNLYTSTAQLRTGAAQNGYAANLAAATPTPFFRRGSMPAASQAVQELAIKYPNAYVRYQVGYTYANGAYRRTTDGKAHQSATSGEQLTADSVIVQYVPAKPIPNDPALRIDVFFVGSGRAQLFAEGKLIEGRWKKESRSSPTEFYDAEGKRLTVPPGRTWIMVVPPETVVETK